MTNFNISIRIVLIFWLNTLANVYERRRRRRVV